MEYCSLGGETLVMDLLFPDEPEDVRLPMVVHVHGGGWVSGTRGLTGPLDTLADELLGRGIAVATIDYRLAPEHPWPAQIEDAKCAIRSLRDRRDEFGLAADRLGAIGESSGGHLVAMAAAAGPEAGWDDAGPFQDRSSRLQATAVLFGPTDLTSDDWQDTRENRLAISAVFGASGPDDPVLQNASPVRWVDGDEAPHVIVHGVEDSLVPVTQARSLADSLSSYGVDVDVVEVANAGHGLVSVSGPIDPPIARIVDRLADFFEAELDP